MVKTRFSSTDVKAMACDVVRAVEGKRVVNIYDLSSKCYLIKLVSTGESEKSFLLLESGVRFHLTKYTRTQPLQPSPFTMLLRRHLRTKRLERVDQLGMDRVVDFKFGSGESASHLILELYSSGNIVLTDSNYEVQALLRSHQFADDVSLKVGEIYPIACTTNLGSLQASASELTRLADVAAFSEWLAAQAEHFVEEQKVTQAQLEAKPSSSHQKKAKRPPTDTPKSPFLRQLLLAKATCVSYLGPDLLDHCLASASINTQWRVSQVLELPPEQLDQLLAALKFAVTSQVHQLDAPLPGYVFLGPPVQASESPDDATFIDFSPLLLKQHDSLPYRTFETFGAAVDEYFTRIELQRSQKEQQSRVLAAEKKFAKVQQDQKRMVESLVEQQRHLQNCAMLLETHADEVEKVCLVINSALAADMAWKDVEAMVEMEQSRGNPLALRISRLSLSDNKIFLRFDAHEVHRGFDSSDDDDDDDNGNGCGNFKTSGESGGVVIVEVDLTLTAHANASRLYCNKKAAQVKEVKTVRASSKALQAMEEQMRKTVTAAQSGTSIKTARKAHWFERFNWFITSEGFLAVAGRDAQQTDAIYKRYMRPVDILVHADVRDALPCFVFARKHGAAQGGEEPSLTTHEHHQLRVTPLAVQEAGIQVVCRSSAWSAKVLASAYWVKADQLSKSDQAGHPMAPGQFFIAEKRNFLPPMPLEMGFGLLFRLDAESAKRHLSDRKLREYDFELESLCSEVMDRFEKYNLAFRTDDLMAGPPLLEEPDEDLEEPDPTSTNIVNGHDDQGGDKQAPLDEEESSPMAASGGLTQDEAATVRDDANTAHPENEEDDEGGDEQPETIVDSDDDIGGKATPGRCARAGQQQQQQQLQQQQQQLGGRSVEGGAGKQSLSASSSGGRKKKLDRKKARRYAEQDEEDVELAMMVLGHASKKSGKSLAHLKEEQANLKKKSDLTARQNKAGVTMLKGDWSQALSLFSPEVQSQLCQMTDSGFITPGSIDTDVLKDLSLFPVSTALQILAELRDSKHASKSSNKSAQLLGLMRRVRKEKVHSSSSAGARTATERAAAAVRGDGGSAATKSRDGACVLQSDNKDQRSGVDLSGQGKQRTLGEAREGASAEEGEGRREAAEKSREDLDDDDDDDGGEGEDARDGVNYSEIDLFTECPTAQDTLLYVLPVCAPYISMQRFKFKVKLSPGSQKKGKAVKQVVELLPRVKDCSEKEKALLMNLPEAELMAAMMSDVKLAAPGLHQQLKHKKQRGQK